MRITKLDTAKKLAKAHLDVDGDVKGVYLLEPLNEEDENDPIKLLEVVEGTLEWELNPLPSLPTRPAALNIHPSSLRFLRKNTRISIGCRTYYRHEDGHWVRR